MATDIEEGKLWIQICWTPLKNLVSHPVHAKGLVNTHCSNKQVHPFWNTLIRSSILYFNGSFLVEWKKKKEQMDK